MQTEPDVLTDHNELILSTSIECVVTGRDTAMKQIEQLIQQLETISRLTSEVGGGMAQDWAMKAGHSYDSWFTEKVDKEVYEVEFFNILYFQEETSYLTSKYLLKLIFY